MPEIMKAYQLGWSSNITSTKKRKNIYKNNNEKILQYLKKQLKQAKNMKTTNKKKRKRSYWVYPTN